MSTAGQGCFIAFGLLWTGFAMVWTFVFWTQSGIFPAVFGLGFVGVGVLILLAGMWRFFSRVKLGEPVLMISNKVMRVGERFNVDYEHTFRQASEVERMAVDLVLQESATYTQGTDTRTDQHDHLADSFELPGGHFEAGEVVRQSFSMQIPRDAMHTFVAKHNKLQWFVRVHVELAGWPDMHESFEIQVLPEMSW
ncbi:MAG: hypothetical protein GTO14_21160 [Anaerolineales bacterium]|nr:hypothetical protein [Anaerolineales bacterium]